MERIKLGTYEHYKGKKYEVIGIALHSEMLEELVIYRTLLGSEKSGNNAWWARPKEMFFGNVNVEGKEVPRFRLLDKLD